MSRLVSVKSRLADGATYMSQLISVHSADHGLYRILDPDKILEKIEVLRRRIQERFPESDLPKVCGELADIARETKETCAGIARPYVPLRIAVGIIIVTILTALAATLMSLRFPGTSLEVTQFLGVLEAALSALVLIGAAMIFLVTVETRIKRSRTLRAINELRAIAHVIDMHQLTKDPSRVVIKGPSTPSSPRVQLTSFELTRYLDYCSEMLSLVGKVAALYVQYFPDRVVLAAVNEFEALTTDLSRKIWQKIIVLNLYEGRGAT